MDWRNQSGFNFSPIGRSTGNNFNFDSSNRSYDDIFRTDRFSLPTVNMTPFDSRPVPDLSFRPTNFAHRTEDNTNFNTQKGTDFLGIDTFMKGSSAYNAAEGKNYKMMFGNDLNSSSTTGMNVIDERLPSAKQIIEGKTSAPKGDWVFRLDKPHRGADFNHLNINPTVSGKADPHLKLPGKTLEAGIAAGKVAKGVSKVATPLALAADAIDISEAVKKDQTNSTTRNTIESVASAVGGWGLAYTCAKAGAAVGNSVYPGVGAIVGAGVGGISCAIAGEKGAKIVAESLGDAFNYDMVENVCAKCGQKFEVRVYLHGNSSFCPSCSK